MIRSYKVEAIIIKHSKLGEADYLLTVLTKSVGRIIVLAKGVRKINSRKAGHLELFNHVRLMLAKGKNLDIVTDVMPIDSFSYLRSKLVRVAQTYKIVELINRLVPVGEQHKEIYFLLIKVLHKLNDRSELDISATLENSCVALLWILGYLPQGKFLKDKDLDMYLEEIMEKKIYSNRLLTKLSTNNVK